MSAAYGYYEGSHAIALGISGQNAKRNFVYKLSGSINSRRKIAFGIGAGIMIGNFDDVNKELVEEIKN